MDRRSLESRMGWVPPVAGGVPQLLHDVRAWELEPRFCGDELLDAAVSRPSAVEACEVLFGQQRTGPSLVRAVLEAMMGPPSSRLPGRNAAWWSISVAVAVDGSEPHEQLHAQDLTMVVSSGARRGALVRREPLRVAARALLNALLRGTSRSVRRDLGMELVFEPGDAPERIARLLARSRVAPDRIPPAHVRTIGELLRAVELLAGPLATRPLLLSPFAVAMADFPVVRVDDYEVRVITNRGEAAFEGWRSRNCLAEHAPTALERGHTLASVWRRRQPVATVELDPGGNVHELLEPGNQWVEGSRRRAILQMMADVGLVSGSHPEQPEGPSDEVAIRISCRAAALMSAEFDPEPEHLDLWSDSYSTGDRMLELLDGRAAWLTGMELAQIRGQSTVASARDHPFTSDDGWTCVAAMMATSGIADNELDPPSTTNARLTARWYAVRLLRRELTIPDRPPPPDTAVVATDCALPQAARDGIREVLRIWREWAQGPARDAP